MVAAIRHQATLANVRRVHVCFFAALVLAGVLVAQSPAANVRYSQAQAAVAIVDGKRFGAVQTRREGADATEATVLKTNATVTGQSSVSTSEAGPSGSASASAQGIDLLNGRVRARSVTRETTGAAPGGEVVGLRVDGVAYGPIRQARTIELEGGGQLVLNEGDTGLRLTTDALAVQIAVVATSTFTRALPDPTPTPKPKPTKTPKPSPTPTATPVPKPPQRLTAGGYAFPVYGDVTYDSTYGAARAAPIVAHEGNDIFAEFGSPAVAVADGRLTKVGTLEISGNRLWLIDDNGDAYFYAHLSSFSSIARNGARVEAGDVLGFVGNTGDAEPTPPHVHFEVHPNGLEEDSVDPYPILRSWQAREDVPPGAYLQRLGADATERPGALVTVRDFIAE